MVWPMLIAGAGVITAGAFFGNAAGKKTGESANTLLIIAGVGLLALMVMRKKGYL